MKNKTKQNKTKQNKFNIGTLFFLISLMVMSYSHNSYADCCKPVYKDCEVPNATDTDEHCKKGREITDGKVDQLLACWTDGFIAIHPVGLISWGLALAAANIYCNNVYSENRCVLNDFSAIPELPNGIDDNCDGVGLGDEFCDGIDNDSDGLIDEDEGSCKFRILLAPYCFNGSDAEFQTAVDKQKQTFFDATGLSACEYKNVSFEVVLPTVFKSNCQLNTSKVDLSAIQADYEAAGYKYANYDWVHVMTDQNLAGVHRGGSIRDGRSWGETTDVANSHPDVIMIHEMGHTVDLDDEYVSEEADSKITDGPNSDNSINYLGKDLGCDPHALDCCGPSFWNPASTYVHDGTQCGHAYAICCQGNLSVADATADVLTNDPNGRCIMSSTTADGPRRFCQRCLTELRANGFICDSRFDGMDRLIEIIAKASSLTTPIFIDGVSWENGRAGLQNISPKETGDMVVRLYKPDGSVWATRGLIYPDGSIPETVGLIPEYYLKFVLPDDINNTDKIKLTTSVDGAVVGQTTINGAEPTADAGVDQTLECTGPLTSVYLDGSGSFDEDGDTITYLWPEINSTDMYAFINLTPGSHEVELQVNDGIFTGSNFVNINVQDTTPPEISINEMEPFVVCSEDNLTMNMPEVTDLCSDFSIQGMIIDSTNSSLILPYDVSDGTGILPPGEHLIEWTATDSWGNSSVATQTIEVRSSIFASQKIDIKDRAKLTTINSNGFPIITSSGDIEVGSNSQTGTLMAANNIMLRSNAYIDGNVVAGGYIDNNQGANVTGTTENENISFAGTDFYNVENVSTFSQGINLEPDQNLEIYPDSFEYINVKSRSTLTMHPGTYYTRQFSVEPQAVINSYPGVIIVVSDNVILRGDFIEPVDLRYSGYNMISIDIPFTGSITAPNGYIKINSTVEGTVMGKNIELTPDQQLICNESFFPNF
ncbi:MAG: hypothetical protein JXR91_06090 [Deltaproteobacteria bacterium]|nr:hypothetical protein [Deltaproteobacteria bacterium]